MTDLASIQEDPRVLLAGFPRPSGNSKTAETWSYDQNQFYQTYPISDKTTQLLEQEKKQQDIVKQLWDYMKEIFEYESTEFSTSKIVFDNRVTLIKKVIQPWLTRKLPSKHAITFESKAGEPEFTYRVLSFCYHQSILKYLSTAIDIIESCFPTILELFPEVEEDPETDEKWVNLDINVQGEVDEILENYNRYISLFISKVPLPKRDKIRLTYNII